jgi:hypothetical protein
MLGIPIEGDSGAGWTVAENSQLTLNIDYTFNAHIGTLGVPLTGTFMIRLRYLDGSQVERFQYSNEFVVDATAPENQANTLVTVARLPSSAFRLQNESERTIWLTTMCNSLPTQYREDDHTVLQHRTAEGTWEIVPYVCEASTTPLEVERGQSVTIDDSWWGRNLGRNLVAGSYRWDLVFYLYVDHDHEPPVLRDVRHVFTEPFEYGQ